MIASAASDFHIIVWRLQTKDLFDLAAKFETPKVEQMFKVSYMLPQIQSVPQGGLEILRLKWNVTGTCFAGSCDDGTVRVW